jgi:hypothetical protein
MLAFSSAVRSSQFSIFSYLALHQGWILTIPMWQTLEVEIRLFVEQWNHRLMVFRTLC